MKFKKYIYIEKKGGQKKQIHRDELKKKKKKEYVGQVLQIGEVLKLREE